jgi:putative transposase
MIVFGFVLAKKAEHSIAMMCRVLEVSRSGYHAWVGRPPSARAVSDARLTARIRVLHKQRRGVYGSPRIWADLVLDDGERIGRKRVERLMRKAGLSGLIVKKWKTTTVRVPGVRVAEDLLDRDFAAGAPDCCWVADITYLRTWEGWAVPRRSPRPLQPPDRGLGDGRSHAHRARRRRASDGARAPPP